MSDNKVLLKGFLESLLYSEKVSRQQKDGLIKKLDELISENEIWRSDGSCTYNESTSWLIGFKEAIESSENVSKRQIEKLIVKVDEFESISDGEVEENEDEVEDGDEYDLPRFTTSSKSSNLTSDDIDELDDLPF